MEIKWEDGFRIKVGVDDENTVLIQPIKRACFP